MRDRDTQSIRKSPMPHAPNAVRILGALDSPNLESIPYRSASEDGYSTVEAPLHRELQEKREKKSFWNWERMKDHDKDSNKPNRDRGRDLPRGGGVDEGAAELTKMIGYLTATASEDWALVLDVCDRVSANETNAKEAVKALRREFKYGEPAGQLSAARLWAIMLRNCSDVFVSQSMNRKFLDTIEELLMNPKTSPVVRERLMDVIAAAAYASQSKKDSRNDREGFRGLWRRVKPIDKPDEGMPFPIDDAMFNPPVANPRSSQYGPSIHSPEPILPHEAIPPASPPPPVTPRLHKKRKSPTRNRIIPHDEDVRRLLQECKIGQGSAGLLSQALFHAKPESFKKDPVVREFYRKCRASQELIYAQIPWAAAEAEKSNVARAAKGDEDTQELTIEQQLLDAILATNEELVEVLKQYEDMDRVAIERKAEYRSKKETRLDPREILGQQHRDSLQQHFPPPPPSRSPSPLSIRSSSPHLSLDSRRPQRHDSDHNTLLAPPPPGPHGPRSPGQFSVHSRTPSPNAVNNVVDTGEFNSVHPTTVAPTMISDSSYDDVDVPVQPSAKALGKQKAVEAESVDSYSQHERDSAYYDSDFPNNRNSHSFDDSELGDHHLDPPWHKKPHYVYDAAAERTAERMRQECDEQELLVNGVH
ncbi:TOM1-like protein 2 [Leucoagaricus sp. SymC.cos]|nr:TOM1-like protein 2 [Leucoagaricus sp. SymC.cos]